MKIYNLKSATTLIEAKGVRILTDPWLTDGEYHGAWYHYPKFDFRPEFFERLDYIYVSHIHPDHFSKATFALLDKSVPVLIHNYASKFLKRNIESIGFKTIELEHGERFPLKNNVHIRIFAADNCDPALCSKFMGCVQMQTAKGSSQIDSLCVIDDGEFTLLNTNDCPWELARDSVAEVLKNYPKIDFLMAGYATASPYPQCFVLTDDERKKAMDFVWKKGLNTGLSYIKYVKPAHYMPFAGTYVLGGPLTKLNAYRGVPELQKARAFFESSVDNENSKCVLLDSYEWFDLETKTQSAPYTPIDDNEKARYFTEVLSQKKFPHEDERLPSLQELLDLVPKAFETFERKRREMEYVSPTVIFVQLDPEHWIKLPLDGSGCEVVKEPSAERFVKASVDPRLLLKLLKGPRFAHWNNVELGSHITYERNPQVFERALYFCLYFFHCA